MLEQGTLAGVRIEAKPEPATSISTAREPGMTGFCSRFQEAARRSGMSTSTIRRWIETGRLEAFRLEGDRRVYVALD